MKLLLKLVVNLGFLWHLLPLDRWAERPHVELPHLLAWIYLNVQPVQDQLCLVFI